MKKFLVLVFSSLLVLGACGNSDSSNGDDSDKKSETKSNDPNKDKDKSKDKDKKKEDKEKSSNEENQNSQEQSQEQQTNTQEQQQTQQAATQEQQTQQNNEYDSTKHSDEYNASHPVSTDDDWTPEEKQRAQQGSQQSSQGDGYDPNNPYMNMPNQEWRKNTGGGLSSGEMQTRNEILKGTYQGDDAQQVLDAINYYEQKYSK